LSNVAYSWDVENIEITNVGTTKAVGVESLPYRKMCQQMIKNSTKITPV